MIFQHEDADSVGDIYIIKAKANMRKRKALSSAHEVVRNQG